MYTDEEREDDDERLRQMRFAYKDSSIHELWALYLEAVREIGPKPKHVVDRERKIIEELIEEVFSENPSKLMELWLDVTGPVDFDKAHVEHRAKFKKHYSRKDLEYAYEQAGYLEKFLFARHQNDIRDWRKKEK